MALADQANARRVTRRSPRFSNLLHVILEYVAPGNDNKEYDGDQAFDDDLPCPRVHLMRGPQRQCDPEQPYRLPGQLEEEQRQHLQWISDAQHREDGHRPQHAYDDAALKLPRRRVIENRWPYRGAEPHYEQKIA